MIEGYYYLHTNGSFIYKREMGGTAADIRESDFARGLWPVEPSNRENAWSILVEASSVGVDKARIKELADQWCCDDTDADVYAERLNLLIDRDGNQWRASGPGFVDIQQSPCGFGDTKLEAMSELCKALGYKPQKMWGATFQSLLKAEGEKSTVSSEAGYTSISLALIVAVATLLGQWLARL